MAFKDTILLAMNFDGNSNDSFGTRNGTNTNITYATGKIGSGAVYSSNTSKIIFSSLATTTTFTLSMWINPIAGGGLSDYSALFADTAGNNGLYLRPATNKISFFYSVTDHLSAGSLTNGVWNNVILVCNAGAVTYYINGSADTNTYTGGQSFTSTSIGNDGAAEWFKGSLDMIQVFSSPATAADAAFLYNGGTGVQFPFNQTSFFFGF